MDERQQPSWSAEGPAVAAEVSERIRSILAESEAMAAAVRHQAEQEAQLRVRSAETEALRIVEESRREAERFLSERIRAVSELSDTLLARGQAVVERLDEADEVRNQLATLVAALGDTAARLANEVRAMPGPAQPAIGGAEAGVRTPDPEPAAVEPEPAAADPEPEPVEAAAPEPEPEPSEPVDAGPTAVPDPEPEVVPTPEGEPDPEPEPLREPTPLRPPPPDEPPPAAAAADPDEAELIEQVLEAERAREATAEDAPAAETSAEATSDADVAAEADLDASTGEAARAANGAAAEAADDGPPLIAITGNEHERREPSAGAGPDQALGARLVALQMAVAGGNRGEVEAHLRRAFELADPAAILDDIFGSGTDSQKRVVWPEAG